MIFLKRSCGCDYVSTVNEKGMYNKLWTEDEIEWTSKCRKVLDSNHLCIVFSVLVVVKVLVICSIRVNFASLWKDDLNLENFCEIELDF